MIQIDIKPGDIILTGKFRNKKVIVKDIGTDEYGSPTVNGKSILKIRVPKLSKKEENAIPSLTNLLEENDYILYKIIYKDNNVDYARLTNKERNKLPLGNVKTIGGMKGLSIPPNQKILSFAEVSPKCRKQK